MSTWISRTLIAAVASLPLTGCDEASGLPFASEGSALEDSGRARVSVVKLAGGAVVVAAPDGYCIDRQSLRRYGTRGFALMARCDTVGVRGGFGSYDLAMITVTTAPLGKGAAAPTSGEVALTRGEGRVLSSTDQDGLALVRFGAGPEPLEGVSGIHWRGAFVLNDHLVALSLYAPEGSDALTDGGRLLGDVARRTRSASAPRATAATLPAAD